MTSRTRSLLAAAFPIALFASSVAAEENPNNGCYGVNLQEHNVILSILAERDPEVYRTIIDKIDKNPDCSDTSYQLSVIADIYEVNQILQEVNQEIEGWENAGRPTLYPKGEAIGRLNIILARLTTEENFVVDDGFYKGSATTLVQLATYFLQIEETRPPINIRQNSHLTDYMEELAKSSDDLNSAYRDFLEASLDIFLRNSFSYCVNSMLSSQESAAAFNNNYRLAKVRALSEPIDPIEVSTGFCATFYREMSPEAKQLTVNYIEGLLVYDSSPASYTPEPSLGPVQPHL